MKAIGISGSPRRGGNSETLLDRALRGLSDKGCEIEKYVLSELTISPCLGEGSCEKDGTCFIDDDMQPIYRALLSLDTLIVASPIYFGSISAQTKIMIDRCQALWVQHERLHTSPVFRKKKGYFIAASAQNRDSYFANAEYIIRNFFAAVGVVYSGNLFVPSVEKKDDVHNIPDYLEKAYLLCDV
ncbi:MAG: flavodoxin family protein [Candidatus Omnitrophica bacterium]|nr:flavodoxin family protein [Candidatus Omnitrophota bacterium]